MDSPTRRRLRDVVIAIIVDETRSTLSSVAGWMRPVDPPLDARTRALAFAAIERAAKKELELLGGAP